MKTYRHLFETCSSDINCAAAVLGVKKSKRLRKIIRRRHLSDEALAELAKQHVMDFHAPMHKPKEIIDGNSRKKRIIFVPTLEESLVHYCAVYALLPLFYKGMYEHTYASIPGRGAHKGKKVIEKWIRNDRKNTKYVLQMDIHHFFNSIPQDVLLKKLARQIHDDRMLELLNKIIGSVEKGSPLGFYTSQWFANWYLQGLDHYIKERLGAVHYTRYNDDMVIFGSNKKTLHKMRVAIGEYLARELGLQLKANWKVFRFDNGENGRFLDFMGFRFYRNRTTLRRSIMLRATRKARKISKKSRPTVYDARQMLAYRGWLVATNTRDMYRKWIQPYVSFKRLRKIISRADKSSPLWIYRQLVKSYQERRRLTYAVEISTV